VEGWPGGRGVVAAAEEAFDIGEEFSGGGKPLAESVVPDRDLAMGAVRGDTIGWESSSRRCIDQFLYWWTDGDPTC
jgi:hypothetical protein